PAKLAFGEAGIPNIIPPNQPLRFEIEMLDVIQPPTPWNTTGSRIRQTDSGMEYLVLGTGQGDKPVPGQVVEVHYSGFLENGTLFDSSYLRAEPLQFTLNTGYVIQGL